MGKHVGERLSNTYVIIEKLRITNNYHYAFSKEKDESSLPKFAEVKIFPIYFIHIKSPEC